MKKYLLIFMALVLAGCQNKKLSDSETSTPTETPSIIETTSETPTSTETASETPIEIPDVELISTLNDYVARDLSENSEAKSFFENAFGATITNNQKCYADGNLKIGSGSSEGELTLQFASNISYVIFSAKVYSKSYSYGGDDYITIDQTKLIINDKETILPFEGESYNSYTKYMVTFESTNTITIKSAKITEDALNGYRVLIEGMYFGA